MMHKEILIDAESENALDQLEPLMAYSEQYETFKEVSNKITRFEIKKAKESLLALLRQYERDMQ